MPGTNGNATSEIRIGGVGGQGIALAGRLLGKAAALFDGKEAVCTQSYGPEARGGASRADIIVSNKPVDYPYVTEADVLAVLFQEAYARYHTHVKPGGMIIVDTGLVSLNGDDADVHGLPATQIAEDLGNRLAANIVILGYLVGMTGVVSSEAVAEAIRTTVKRQHVDLNIEALNAGKNRAQYDSPT